jgi:glycosyltransferase involved in cell wall biosynthesis
MLDPWFRRRYPLKHLKKWSYWVLVERRVLRDAAAVVYLSETERAFGRKAFWPYSVRRELCAGLAIGTPPEQPDRQRRSFFERFPELQSRRLVLFMGRLHPVKGCDLLLDAFATVSDQDPQLHLVLAGPDPIGWKQVLQDRARDLGLEGKVTWAGMLTGDLKWGALRCAEVLVLPAHTEGFPVVVVEGMACGVPVLISNKVGIWREVYDTGGALIAEDDLQGTREMLAHYLRLSPNEKENMRRGARDGYLHQFEPSVVNGRFVSLLRDLGIADRSQERSR